MLRPPGFGGENGSLMARRRKKSRVIRKQDSGLEALLRFEIVIALFALIGLYYFLSFSPFRMPRQPIASRPLQLAPLPPASPAAKKIEVEPPTPPADSPAVVSPPANSPSAAISPPGVKTSTPAAESAVAERDSVALPEVMPAQKPPAARLAEAGSETSAPVSPAVSDKASAVSVSVATSSPTPAAKPLPAGPAKKLPAASVSVPVVPSFPTPLPPPARCLIEVGDYVLPGERERAAARLKELGYKFKSEIRTLPTPMYRVYLGPVKTRSEALKLEQVCRKMGDEPFLSRRPEGWLVIISSFYLQSNVVAWENMYDAAGLRPRVMQEKLPIKHTLFLVEAGGAGEAPEKVLARLREAGFAAARRCPAVSDGTR